MKRLISLSLFVAFASAFVILTAGNTLEAAGPVPASDDPLLYYGQGGIVVKGIAYFTADPTANSVKVDSQSVTSFDAETLAKVRRYDFGITYDSAPYIFRKKDGTELIVCRQKDPGGTYRLSARRLGTDALEWTSPANLSSNAIYYGVSAYFRPDGTQILFAAVGNGLHAISGETGAELWSIPGSAYGGTTPAVDQGNAWVFYQNSGHLYKVQAQTGAVLSSKDVAWPNVASSFNTVFVNDSHGRFVLTRWHTDAVANAHYDCGIRVYDESLNLIWEKTGLPYGKKNTITYWDGKMLVGTGNNWGPKYTENENATNPWKRLTAFHIKDGSVAWICDLSDLGTYRAIFNAPYFNGYIYAEVEVSNSNAYLIRIRASDGKRMEVLTYGHRLDSCAPCIIAHGKVFSGNLAGGRYVNVTRIAENTHGDWPSVFYDPQTNAYAMPDDPNAVLVPMKEIGRWSADLTVTVSGPTSPTTTSPIPFTITFNKAVTGLTMDDIIVTNGVKGTLSGSGAIYTLPVTPTAPGAVTCQVKDWAVLDPAENGNHVSDIASVSFETQSRRK